MAKFSAGFFDSSSLIIALQQTHTMVVIKHSNQSKVLQNMKFVPIKQKHRLAYYRGEEVTFLYVDNLSAEDHHG